MRLSSTNQQRGREQTVLNIKWEAFEAYDLTRQARSQ